MRHRTFRCVAAALALFAGFTAQANAQGTQPAVITGKVTGEGDLPLEFANVYMNELNLSVPTNAQGVYTLTIPAARALGQAVNLRVRAIAHVPGVIAIRLTPGRQEHNFSLRKDINRLSEVVVTGSIEGTERAKVPFSVGRLAAEDVPVVNTNPIQALSGKVAGLRVSSTSGRPGTTPEILMRGPTSINATDRGQSPMIIVDGVIMRVGSLDEIGGLDIESVEVVKGAAGASLYGTTAANGVMIIKTKRGNTQDGVKFNSRVEYGFNDVNSLNYGMPVNHHLQLDETGTRFCIQGASNVSPCSRTTGFMQEIMRINSVNADTTRTSQTLQNGSSAPPLAELTNNFQASIWPGQYYNAFAQISTKAPQVITSLDATGRVGSTRFFSSASYTSDGGAIKFLNGQQNVRGRVNLDFEARSNLNFSSSTLYDMGRTDLNSAGTSFGGLLRGAPAGTNYLATDSLGRYLIRGGGTGIRGSGNGGGTFLYNPTSELNMRQSRRFLSNLTMNYYPAEWISVEGAFGFDSRIRTDDDAQIKGYRTTTLSTSTNSGNQSINDLKEEALNGSISATLRKQVTTDLAGKLVFKGLYDTDRLDQNRSAGEIYVVKDVFTLSNTSTNKTATSSSQTITNMGVLTGANVDWKGKYILDGTFRYDGSSLFGSGNRWAPFGRLSAVWRVSEEKFWKLKNVSDFRFRVSRGTAGNTPSFYAQYETYQCSVTGCSLGQAGNSRLKPETTTETEWGLDFTLFDRLGVELTNANSQTRNQILNVPTPSSLGFSSQWQNAGTLANHTWELALNLPVISKRDIQWNMKATWDRTRTYVQDLFIPEYFTNAGTGQGTGSFFLISANDSTLASRICGQGGSCIAGDNQPMNRYGNIYGRYFYRSCSELPASIRDQCGEGRAYQVDNNGWLVWVGAGNTTRDGITRNLWQTKLPAAQSPWNYPLYWGMPIIDRPLRGQPGEGIGTLHILGNTLPDFRMTWNNTVTYKRLTAYALFDGTFGHRINNQGEGWGLLDMSSGYFDQGGKSVEDAKPVGYSWRVGGAEGVGTGGFYDILGPNDYNVEDGTYVKLRELSLTYRIGAIAGSGDWTLGIIGRNMKTWTSYSGYDPETGATGTSQASSGIINQVDAFGYPTLRTFTLSLSTRF